MFLFLFWNKIKYYLKLCERIRFCDACVDNKEQLYTVIHIYVIYVALHTKIESNTRVTLFFFLVIILQAPDTYYIHKKTYVTFMELIRI